MFFKNKIKFIKLDKQIRQICSENNFEFKGEIKKYRIDDPNWSFAVKKPDKNYLVKIITPYGFKQSFITICSDRLITADARIPILKGYGGAISFPLYKDYHFVMQDKAFGIEASEAEKIYLVYPACMTLYKFISGKHSVCPIGDEFFGVKLFDGAALRAELQYGAFSKKEKRHSAVVPAIGL